MLKSEFVLTMEFVSSDIETGTIPLPPGESQHWDRVLATLRLTPEQLQESAVSYEMAQRCKVRAPKADAGGCGLRSEAGEGRGHARVRRGEKGCSMQLALAGVSRASWNVGGVRAPLYLSYLTALC